MSEVGGLNLNVIWTLAKEYVEKNLELIRLHQRIENLEITHASLKSPKIVIFDNVRANLRHLISKIINK